MISTCSRAHKVRLKPYARPSLQHICPITVHSTAQHTAAYNVQVEQVRPQFAPPRGPLRDLWVVVVTTWECLKGSATTSAATRPDVWAMSVMRYAPTLSAAFLMRA